MLGPILGWGFLAIFVMTIVEDLLAYRAGRRPQIPEVAIAGAVGMAFFVAVMYAGGAF